MLLSLSSQPGTDNLAELVSAVMQRVDASNDQNQPQLLVGIKTYIAHFRFLFCFSVRS